ncbi:sirohydrochlorin chelatase [Streptomyces sp. TRM66268-LWL]|uniref:Sirohydrochlorin chelatase n=1 Tax=Streptomyces polyasparticus TaxID=2767826 RepID=A0ABR7SMP7_9ACTN|nr:sirohydrochlorin chelatase [Streptomyces polyasparticus]MBC9716124.1 sirohydrochlorin chelatase [Streptomyces polyasparticus]
MGRISAQLGSQLSHVRLDGRRHPDAQQAPALVLVGHGSRNPATLATVKALRERVRELRPELAVRLGHIEIDEPLLPDTLAALAAEGTTDAVLVPLLLSRGFHVKHDLPAAARAAALRTRIAEPLGEHPLLIEALYDRLVEAGWPAEGQLTDRIRRGSGVVLAAAGSRDPESSAGTRRIAGQLAERLGVPVVAAYACAAAPAVPAAIRALAARGRHRVAIASCFTAPGRFAADCAKAAPWIASAPLGTHPAVARLLLHRYDQALRSPAATGHLRLVPA